MIPAISLAIGLGVLFCRSSRRRRNRRDNALSVLALVVADAGLHDR
jgi:hypothetical protein